MHPRIPRKVAPRIASTRGRSAALGALLGVLAGCSSPEQPRTSGTADRAPVAAPQPREELSLDGPWTVWLDPANAGLAEGWVADLTAGRRPATAPGEPLELPVPGPLEGSPASQAYDGVAFYVRNFEVPSAPGSAGATGDAAGDAWAALHFEQVNYACRAWLDGVEVGAHDGGYDAFDLELVGPPAPGPHRLVLRVVDPGGQPVDGLTLKTTPHSKESWYENHGGLLGGASLRLERGVRVVACRVTAECLAEEDAEADAKADAKTTGRVSVQAELAAPAGAGAVVRVVLRMDGAVVRERDVAFVAGRGVASLDAEVPGVGRWSPEHPELHRVTLSVRDPAGDERELLARDVGFRTVEVRDGDVLVNGVRRVLKGVLWQPHYTGTGGVVPPAAELRAEAAAIKATGFDLVRAHVRPAPPAFLDACDALGLFVLEEPAIGWVDDDPALLPRLRRELDWMVARDAQRPCLLAWGVLNELSGKAYRHGRELVAHLAQLDGTRPILEDSGGFIGGGRAWLPGASTAPLELTPMVDEHAYPPYPLPVEERDRLLALGNDGADDADGMPRLVFVSEFGYGTLQDSVTAVKGFEARGLRTPEYVGFRTGAGVERRTAEQRLTGTDTHWRAEADENQADVAEEMVEALRSNPAVDLLCYTQWRAVATESSAGVVGPWGEDRPVRERLRHALRPLMCAVFPDGSALRKGGTLTGTVAVVNDTEEPVTGALTVEAFEYASSLPVRDITELGVHTFPSGVTALRFEALDRQVGSWQLYGVLQPGKSAIARAILPEERSSPRTVHVIATGWSRQALAAWTPPGDDASVALLQRLGWPTAVAPPSARAQDVAASEPDVILLAQPYALGDALTLEELLALWRWVHDGGEAVVLLRSPAEAPLGDLLGLRRGIESPPALPIRVAIASAPGNFMGRLFVLLPGAYGAMHHGGLVHVTTPSVLGRDDDVLSPRAMLVGTLPEDSVEHVLAVGHIGNRIGAVDVSVPFGRGRFRFMGLPLLNEVKGQPDPRRDKALEQVLRDAADHTRAARAAAVTTTSEDPGTTAGAPAADLSPQAAATAASALDELARWSTLGDRISPWQQGPSGPQLPAAVAAALDGRDVALLALLEGRTTDALAQLEQAAASLRSPEAAEFLALQEAVLAELLPHARAKTLPEVDLAYEVTEAWVRGVIEWFAGERAAACDRLRAALARLRTAG
jgi:hypothetical protein